MPKLKKHAEPIETAYCPICSLPLGSWKVGGRWVNGCLRCNRAYKSSEILWRTKRPKVTKKMLRYQAALKEIPTTL